jgi:hypothetical protein
MLWDAAAVRVKDFYADPRRAGSDEVSFGSAWQSDGSGPWKVVWLEATGELVAFNEALSPGDAYQGWGGGAGGDGNFVVDMVVGTAIDAAIDGVIRHVTNAGERAKRRVVDEVVPIGIERDGERLRHALRGWERHMPEPDGLAWVAARCDDDGAHDIPDAEAWYDAADWGRASDVWPGSDAPA